MALSIHKAHVTILSQLTPAIFLSSKGVKNVNSYDLMRYKEPPVEEVEDAEDYLMRMVGEY